MKILAILASFLLTGVLPSEAQKIEGGTLTDSDGNVYRTVFIGNYEWMAENLKTTKYNNGTSIHYVSENVVWPSLSGGAYSWYNNEVRNKNIYGALYNWYAVNTGKLCPDGWRVPTDKEWKYLEGYADTQYGIGNKIWDNSGLRGYDAAIRLKDSIGWRLNGNGTNNFGFNALPGGERLNSFNNTGGSSGFWWSSTPEGDAFAWYRCIIYSLELVSRDAHPKRMGFSVRCLRDAKVN
jgi:uncharacterized protein (TIGR02145 family)